MLMRGAVTGYPERIPGTAPYRAGVGEEETVKVAGLRPKTFWYLLAHGMVGADRIEWHVSVGDLYLMRARLDAVLGRRSRA